jgi:type IV secretory pathway TrbF-like protein
MPPPQPSTPALCRLCRQPLVASAVKCPSCGARQSWTDRARGIESHPRRRAWRIAAGAAILAVLIVGTLVWLSVVREIKRPILSDDGVASGSGRPASAECAQLAADLTNRATTDERVSPELRDRIRQCFDRR